MVCMPFKFIFLCNSRPLSQVTGWLSSRLLVPQTSFQSAGPGRKSGFSDPWERGSDANSVPRPHPSGDKLRECSPAICFNKPSRILMWWDSQQQWLVRNRRFGRLPPPVDIYLQLAFIFPISWQLDLEA